MAYKILVVEDDSYLRNNISDILGSENFDVISADNGLDGIALAKNHSPDLIISDIMMPKMDGFQFIEELMKYDELVTTPVIFLSAKAEHQSIRMGMKLGADDYLVKPFQIDDLLDAVRARLKKVELIKQKTNTLRDEISSKIPHELRTPLVPILGFSEMLKEDNDPDVIKELAGLINKNGKILHQKIEKFLFYKDLLFFREGNREQLKAESPSNLSEERIRHILGSIDEKLKPKNRVKLDFEPVSFDVDELFIETIIKELLENALKYSQNDKEVYLKGSKIENQYVFEFNDSGYGMSEHQLHSLEPFGRFDQKNFYESGLGLGLAIVSKIVNILGGSITIKSELRKYTSCKVSIPLY